MDVDKQTAEIDSIWKNRTYLKLFSSYAISTMGKFFDMLAVILLFSYVWQTEPWMVALVPVVYALPHALFSQFAGIYVDKNKKVFIMLLADVATACLTIMLIFISSPWVALVILLVRSTFTIVHFPAQQALIQQVVQPDFVLKAVTLNGTVNQLSKIIGPFLGASIAAAFSPKMSFVIYAVALVISACILLFVRHVDTDRSKGTSDEEKTVSFWHTWRNGWHLLFRSKVLFISFCFALLAFTSIQLVDAQYAVLFREVYPDNPSVLGWAMSTSGAGAVGILLYLNRLKELRKYGWYLGGSIFFIGFGFTTIGFTQPGVTVLWPIAASLFVGIGVGIFSVIYSYILQKESPQGKVGQMSGMFNSLTGMILLVAPVTGGLLVQWFGVFTLYQVGGFTTLLIGLTGIIMQKILWGGKRESVKKEEEILNEKQGVG